MRRVGAAPQPKRPMSESRVQLARRQRQTQVSQSSCISRRAPKTPPARRLATRPRSGPGPAGELTGELFVCGAQIERASQDFVRLFVGRCVFFTLVLRLGRRAFGLCKLAAPIVIAQSGAIRCTCSRPPARLLAGVGGRMQIAASVPLAMRNFSPLANSCPHPPREPTSHLSAATCSR